MHPTRNDKGSIVTGILPEWTERAEKRGLDPLGMQNLGVALYQRLVPGISNVTLRMRYYGFFCWLSDSYAREIGSTDYEAWRRWVRRGEALLALASARASWPAGEGVGGIGGIEWANEALGQSLAAGVNAIDFSAAASNDKDVRRYLRQSMGVFGGAYFSQLSEMGLFEMGPDGLQRPTATGRELAHAFRNAIGEKAEAAFIKALGEGFVSIEGLDQLRPLIPAGIAEISPEREVYEELLTGREGSGDGAQSRRLTVTLLLRTAGAANRRPDEGLVRWQMFEPLQGLEDVLEEQRVRWEAYHCQDMFQVAAAALLDWAIELLGSVAAGLYPAQLSALAEERLTASLGADAGRTWFALREGTDHFEFEEAWAQLTGRGGGREQRAALAARLMVALDARVAKRPDLASAIDVELRPRGGARSILGELGWLRDRGDRKVQNLLAQYLLDRVVRRHSQVALQKLRRQRDYTFLLESHDGRLVPLSGYQPVPTTPRLTPAIQFLTDVSLVDANGLTARGRAVLGANA